MKKTFIICTLLAMSSTAMAVGGADPAPVPATTTTAPTEEELQIIVEDMPLEMMLETEECPRKHSICG